MMAWMQGQFPKMQQVYCAGKAGGGGGEGGGVLLKE